MSGILAQGARFHLGVRPKTMRLRIIGRQYLWILQKISKSFRNKYFKP